MRLRPLGLVLFALIGVWMAGSASAWWDTQVQVIKPPPTVALWQAEDAKGLKADDIIADDAAWGGKAARLLPGGVTLAFDHDARETHYVLFVVCRAESPEATGATAAVILRLRVTDVKRNVSREWRQRIACNAQYEDFAHLYFPVYEAGPQRIEVFSDKRSVRPLRVDYLALKDVSGELPCVGEKRGQNLHTPAEVAAIRATAESKRLAEKLAKEQAQRGLAGADAKRLDEWRRETFESMWAAIPPRNLHFAGEFRKPDKGPLADWVNARLKASGDVAEWRLQPGWGPWAFVHPKTNARYTLENWVRGETAGDCAFPDDGTGFFASAEQTGAADPASGRRLAFETNWMGAALMRRFQDLRKLAAQRADEYLRTGNDVAGWEGVCALLAFVEMYPDIDYQTQRFSFDHTMYDMNPYGKFVYSGWAVDIMDMIRAYDALFPVIQGNVQLAGLVGVRVPWVRSPQDVVRLADTNLLQHVRDCVGRLVIRAGEGDSELVLGTAAVVQGPGKASEWMFDLLFTRCHFRMMNRGGIQDHLTSSYNRDGCNYIGSLEYTKAACSVATGFAELCRRYKALGGRLRFDLSDATRYPRVAEAPWFVLNRSVAGGFAPRIGDWGMATDPPLRAEEKTFRPVHLYGFLAHGDPRFAWLVKALGREDESDEVWQRIESASAVVDRSPFLMSRSRSMPGFGMEVLEAGADQADPRQKTAVVVRTGAGQGHGHCDTLGIALYARGCRALPDNGRRGGNPNSRASRVHNLVEVDDQDFLCTAYGRSGVGWAEAFKDLGDAGYVRASAAAPSHPNLKVYRRDVALVEVEAGEAYVADVFRVAGGRVHTWCCQGPVNSKPDMLELNAAMQPGDQGLPASYLKEKFSDKALGVAGDLLQAAWRVDPAAVTSYVGRKDNLPEVVVRAWHLGAAGRPVIRAWAHIRDYTKQGTPHNYVFVRNEGQEGLEGAYVTVTESYDVGKPLLQSVEFERIRRGASTGAMASRALKIRARGPQDDLVVFGGDGSEAVALEAGVRVQAQFALLSAGQKDLRKVAVVGGTLVEGRGFSIRPHAARYSAAVQEVDMAAGAVRLDKPFPVRGLEGASFLVQRPGAGHNAGYLVSRVEGDRVFLRGSMALFLSAITHFDEASGAVVTEMPPTLLECTPTYYDGLPLMNEAGRALGRVRVVRGDRWMYLGWPEPLRWNQKIAMSEIVDADGDGRRTLRMIAAADLKRRNADGTDTVVKAGQRMADLEVARVSDDGYTIWHKDPPEQFLDAAGVVHESWPFHAQKLMTEDGKRTLRSTYPGWDVSLAVEGRRLTAADFPDADGDGRRCLLIGDIMAGDRLDAPTHVVMDQVEPGAWRVRADCGATVQLPAQGDVLVTRRGEKAWPGERVVPRGKPVDLPMEAMAGPGVWLIDQAKQGR